MSPNQRSTQIPRPAGPTLALFCLCLCLCAALALFAAPALAAQTFAADGDGAGQVRHPDGIAVDQSTGTVYVADTSNFRIDEFDSSGHFLMAFGFGVATGANELQTCTTLCRAGLGTAAGAIKPENVAVDQASHAIYIGEQGSQRVQKFTPAGQFLLMFGKGVDHGPHHPGNLCTAAYLAEGDACGAGLTGGGPGEFSPAGLPIAVDSFGDVWVGDADRLERFDEAGEYLSEAALPGAGRIASLVIDPDPSSPAFGDLFALNSISSERQQIHPPASGEYTLSFEGQITTPLPFDAHGVEIQKALEALPAIGPGNVSVFETGTVISFVQALADTNVPQVIPSAGSMTTIEEGASGKLFKLNPAGTLLTTEPLGGRPQALGFDGSGGLVVGDATPPYRFYIYDPASFAKTKAFGLGEVIVPPGNHPGAGSGSGTGPAGNALAFGEAADSLYAVNDATEGLEAAQIFAIPGPGPLVPLESAGAIQPTTATLEATVNPENHSITYHFEYIAKAAYEVDGSQFGAGAVKLPVPDASLPASFEYEQVKAALGTLALTPSTLYHYRLVAEDSEGHQAKGADQSFETQPPLEITGSSALSVSATGATLEAQINPLGAEARYRVLYGTSASYGSETAPTSLAAGSSPLAVTPQLHSLQPGTTYHYRFVATDERGGHPYGGEGPDLTFTTQPAGSQLLLPDARGWEQVSPVDKRGGGINSLIANDAIQAATSGAALTYVTTNPIEADPRSHTASDQVLSTRSPLGGWSSRGGINLPQSAPVGAIPGALTFPEYRIFSTDLSLGLLAPVAGSQFTSLAPEAFPPDTDSTPYLRHDDSCEASPATCYQPLLTAAPGFADVIEGAQFGRAETGLQGAAPDLRHVILRSSLALTSTHVPKGQEPLYEYSAGAPSTEALQAVSLLPAGEGGAVTSASLGATISFHFNARDAISADGSRVFFSVNNQSTNGAFLYMRDTVKGETLRLDLPEGAAGQGEPMAVFQIASRDGSRVFFTDTQELTAHSSAESPDLYECRIVEEAGHHVCRLRDLTPHIGAEAAGVLGIVAGASQDGTRLYFAANGVLAANQGADGSEASPGDCRNGGDLAATCNLYAWHEDPVSHEASTIFVATISGEDSEYLGNQGNFTPIELLRARVSTDGRYLAFMSNRSLTGYDNRDTINGEPDEEVYLYDAAGESLVCASCNPTGARPREATFGGAGSLVVSRSEVGGHQAIAAILPSANSLSGYQTRYLSDSGRLFFNSHDALVPQDSNGTWDVYQYEPPQGEEAPASDSCATESPTYSPRSEGCVDLISSGASSEESAFLDASESGDDVFFLTSSRLASTDIDNSYDVYDAHVCSAAEPCASPPAPRPPACEGDACQPPAQAPNDPTPGSLDYRGAGNLRESPTPRKSHKAKKHHKAKHHRKRANRNRGESK